MYLKPKVLGLNLPSDVVKERNLYGANPWQVFDPENYPWILNEVSPGKFEKLAYAFVNLTKKATNSNNNKSTVGRENYNKMAGCGVWAGKTPRTEIKDFDGKLIGERRMLSFKIKEVSDEEDSSRVGHWRMHEYNLCGINRNISNPSNIVLCRITLDHSKNAPIQNLHPDKTTHSIKATGEKNDTKKNSVKMDVVVTDSVQTCHNDVQTCHNDDAEQTLTDDVLDDLLNRFVVEGEDGKATGEKNDTKKNSVKMDVVTDSVQTCHNDVQTCHNDDAEQTLTDDVLDDLLNRYVVEGEDGNYYCNMLDFEFGSNPELQVEQTLEDVTTNMGKRKLQAETSYVLRKNGSRFRYASIGVHSTADCLFSEACNVLHQICRKKSIETVDMVYELKHEIGKLERILQEEKAEFEESLQKVLKKNIMVGKPNIDILEINRLGKQLIFHAYIWVQRLIYVSNLKEKLNKSVEKPSELSKATSDVSCSDSSLKTVKSDISVNQLGQSNLINLPDGIHKGATFMRRRIVTQRPRIISVQA